MTSARKGPFVVLEGPDGSGKTTLANALIAVGFEYDHCGPPEKNARSYFMDALERHSVPAVIDRLHVGSFVYGNVFRGMDDLSEFDYWTIEGTLMANGAVLIYCSPPTAVMDADIALGPDSPDATIYENPDKQAEVRARYREFMNTRNRLINWRYDWTIPGSLEQMVKRCRQFADGRLAVRDYVDSVPALGNVVNPSFVFVGDQPGTRPRHLRYAKERGYTPEQTQKFMRRLYTMAGLDQVFGGHSAGPYLHMALTSSGLDIWDYAVFNSVQLDGRRLADFTTGWWHNVETVALGRNASAELTKAGITHRVVPHPQHVRRFHYKRVGDYGRALQGAKPWTCDTDYCKDQEWGYVLQSE